jgi:hypothetical protein
VSRLKLTNLTEYEMFETRGPSRYTGRVESTSFNQDRREVQSTSRRAALLLAFITSVSALFVGCLAPTLPLPPPARPEVTVPDDAGMVHIRGTVRSGSEVFAKNRRTLDIVGKETDESGQYDLIMAAESNDRLVVWYTDGLDESDFVEVLVPAVPDDGGLGGAGGASGD